MDGKTMSSGPWNVDADAFPSQGDEADKLAFLVRYAVLAPSSHNTQPWRFTVGEREIRIYVDRSRWLKVADSDQRELYVSLGCALENLLLAADHFGYGFATTYLPEGEASDLAVVVELRPNGEACRCRPEELFDAIPERRTNHNVFDAQPLPQEVWKRLQACDDGDEVSLRLTDDPAIKREVDQMIVEADAIQFADPAWREELGTWLGRGVFGTPWLMSKVSQLAVTYLNLGSGTAKKDSELLMSAPVLAVIDSAEDDRESQIKAGQLFQRAALTAATLGVRVHPMSQILEIPELKARVAELIPAGSGTPQHTFRLGFGEPEGEPTPRRPLGEVMEG